MPTDDKSLEEWRHRLAQYELKNKGHCGRCGLPYEHCYHRDGRWQAERQKRSHGISHGIRETGEVVEFLYTTTIQEFTDEQLLALPMPPTGMTKDIACKELERREWLRETREKILTRWERVLQGVL